MSPIAYALDESSRALRPLIGTPGSAYLGRPLALPFAIRWAELRGATGVVVDTEGIAHRLTNLDRTELGPATAVWLDATGTQTLLAVAPDQVRFPNDPPVTLSAPVAAVAFSQRCAILATNADDIATLHRLCADRPTELQSLRTFPGLAITALAIAGDSLFAAARAQRQILHIREPFGSSPAATFDTEAPPIALAAPSPSGVLAAFEDNPRLLALPSRDWIDLPTPPDRLQWLSNGRLLACSAVNIDQPLLVLDLAQDRNAFFIPLTRSEE
ncbi:MAG: hypothetical protein JNK87_09845 [Bryobacterales bacterium]|nr:hypothetical protein [Bryobacterales bacterium]